MSETTVLIVDDAPDLREMVRDYLEEAGYRVYESEDGATGFIVLEETHPDIVLLDYSMPGMDGIEFCNKARKHFDPRVSMTDIIMLTGRPDEEVRALDAGANDFICKPFEVDRFLARIRVGARRADVTRKVVTDPSGAYSNEMLELFWTWSEKQESCCFVKISLLGGMSPNVFMRLMQEVCGENNRIFRSGEQGFVVLVPGNLKFVNRKMSQVEKKVKKEGFGLESATVLLRDVDGEEENAEDETTETTITTTTITRRVVGKEGTIEEETVEEEKKEEVIKQRARIRRASQIADKSLREKTKE